MGLAAAPFPSHLPARRPALVLPVVETSRPRGPGSACCCFHAQPFPPLPPPDQSGISAANLCGGNGAGREEGTSQGEVAPGGWGWLGCCIWTWHLPEPKKKNTRAGVFHRAPSSIPFVCCFFLQTCDGPEAAACCCRLQTKQGAFEGGFETWTPGGIPAGRKFNKQSRLAEGKICTHQIFERFFGLPSNGSCVSSFTALYSMVGKVWNTKCFHAWLCRKAFVQATAPLGASVSPVQPSVPS